jgi:L-threonylcarbamoyladenylate synthase
VPVTPPNPPFATEIRPYGKAAIEQAARLIRDGLPVAVPTETVYGLAADATNPKRWRGSMRQRAGRASTP